MKSRSSRSPISGSRGPSSAASCSPPFVARLTTSVASAEPAPEIIKEEQYDYKVDCWSIGVMLFEFLSDQQPFNYTGTETEGLFNVIKEGKYEFNENWNGISNEAKDLVTKLLDKNPKSRYTMTQIKEHPWYEKF
jgi:serine/threonine protein kinase